MEYLLRLDDVVNEKDVGTTFIRYLKVSELSDRAVIGCS